MTRKSVKSARALPRNVDSGKLTRKNTKQPNCYTGQPRRWVYCGARTLADDILEIAEVYASNTEPIPFKIRKSMAESMRHGLSDFERDCLSVTGVNFCDFKYVVGQRSSSAIDPSAGLAGVTIRLLCVLAGEFA